MEALLALLLILGVLNESETPVWSEEPTECKEITFEENKDVLRLVTNSAKGITKATQRKSYICVEEPEVVEE